MIRRFALMKGDKMEEERKIILRAKKDIKAFNYLYEKYFPRIFNYVNMRVQNRDITEEIVSNVFYKAMKKLYLFKFQKIPFSAWLYRISISEISNYFRKEKKHSKLNQNLYIKKSIYKSVDLGNTPSYEFIYKYIRMLNIADQEIITLRYFDKKSFEEISQIMNVKENTARVRLHRSLKKLQSLIPEQEWKNENRRIS